MAFNYQAVVHNAAANGLVGLVAICFSIGLAHYGVTIPPEQITAAAFAVITIILHAHITSINFDQSVGRLNDTVKSVAALVPVEDHSDGAFPASKNGGTGN